VALEVKQPALLTSATKAHSRQGRIAELVVGRHFN